MPAKVKKMKAELKVDPCSEMQKQVAEWLRNDPELKKLYNKPFHWVESPDPELDTRKWNPKKLSAALAGLVKFELRILSVKANEAHKAIQKSPVKAKLKAYKDLTKAYNKTLKTMGDKCSLAIEEVAADDGDNTKTMKAGKSAVASIKSLPLGKLFSEPRVRTSDALIALSKSLSAIEKIENEADDEKDDAKKKALETVVEKRKVDASGKAARVIEKAKGLFENAKSKVEGGLEEIGSLASDIKKNDDVDEKIKQFGKSLEKANKQIVKLKVDMASFAEDIGDITMELKGKGKDIEDLTAKKVDATRFKFLKANQSLDKAATKMASLTKTITGEYTKIARELK